MHDSFSEGSVLLRSHGRDRRSGDGSRRPAPPDLVPLAPPPASPGGGFPDTPGALRSPRGALLLQRAPVAAATVLALDPRQPRSKVDVRTQRGVRCGGREASRTDAPRVGLPRDEPEPVSTWSSGSPSGSRRCSSSARSHSSSASRRRAAASPQTAGAALPAGLALAQRPRPDRALSARSRSATRSSSPSSRGSRGATGSGCSSCPPILYLAGAFGALWVFAARDRRRSR